MFCFVFMCCVFCRVCVCAWISNLTQLWGIGQSSSANSCCCTSWRRTFLRLAGSFLLTALKHYLWRPSYTWTATRSSLSLQVCSVYVPIQIFTPACPPLHLFLDIFIITETSQTNSALYVACKISFYSHHSCTNQCSQPQWCSNVEDTTGPFCQESAEECAFAPWQCEGRPRGV